MNDPPYVLHRSQSEELEPIQPELSEPMELEAAVERSQEASAIAIYSKGFDSSLTDEIR
jgi:hypothetical protein